ncbi:MAG: penicillin-binding protein [Melioribacteraceae bacterium]|nr:transpeptidase family protein [Melioribacteraceae bacterium]MDD3557038.1 penicillin-binding protein [Melioribacteraceae bacterium]
MNSLRTIIVTLVISAFFVVLCVQLFVIQVNDHQIYVDKAKRQQNKSQILKAKRGVIKDREGNVLAYSKDDISIYIDTRMKAARENIDTISSVFSKIFSKPKGYYKNLIENGSGNICLVKKASRREAILLNEFVNASIFRQEDFTRIYPYGRLASHILGFTNFESTGVSGIENQCEDYLTGIDGKLSLEKDGNGAIVSVDEEFSIPAIDGNDVYLTINKNYQGILEEELQQGFNDFNAETAVGIVMNPNTGEVLALANYPNFDPSNAGDFSDSFRRNRAISDIYEPGSTLKSIIMSILLEENLVKENEVIDTENGSYFIRNVKISDTHKYDKLTVREIFEHSSNIGMSKLVTRLKPNELYKYLRDFGLGQSTSLGLPGEVGGTLRKPNQYSAVSMPYLSFGYEIGVTPLQLITAFSALINGGKLLKPYMIDKILDKQGNTIFIGEKEEIRKVISQKTSEKIIDFMKGAVENGTGKAARLDNVYVGGKTGTSQRYLDGKYEKKNYNSSFVGFFPVENPQLICLILITNPKKKYYGGEVAAPIFKGIAERLLKADFNLVPQRQDIERNDIENQLFADLNNAPVNDQLIFLNVDEKENTENQTDKTLVNRMTMPNLLTKSKRDAIAMLSSLDLKYKIIGTGNVVSQSIEAGSAITDGTVLLIKCEPTNKIENLRLN